MAKKSEPKIDEPEQAAQAAEPVECNNPACGHTRKANPCEYCGYEN